MKTLVLYVFHGSNGVEAQQALEVFRKQLESISSSARICFLKNQEPCLANTLLEAAQSDFELVRVLPMFLLPGSHVTKDIPETITSILRDYPGLNIITEDCLIKDQVFLSYLTQKL